MKQRYFNSRSVNHEQFSMQMTHITKGNKWLQILAGEDSPPKPLWSENAEFKFSVNNEGEDVNKKPQSRGAEETSLSTAKATPTTRDRGTEEQEIGAPTFFFLSVLLITILARFTPTSTRAKQCSTFYWNKGCH